MLEQVGRFIDDGGRGVVVLGAFVAAFGLLLGIKAWLGLEWWPGIVISVLVVVAVGWGEREASRWARLRQLRRQALIRRDLPETSLDPVVDVGVKPWLGGGPTMELSPFIERRAMGGLRRGLKEKRFAILVGDETSGKSRLAYEAAVRWSQVALIATRLPRHEDDPLTELMNDRRGIPVMENNQILLLTDFAKRVRSGWISGERIRRWLDRNPRVMIVATVDTAEREAMAEDWIELEGEAEVVFVGKELTGRELRDAAREYRHIESSQLPNLTSYLASGPPLRDALADHEDGSNSLGCAIVAAVADWHRMSMERPAPLAFVRQIASREHEMDEGQFQEELEWALKTRAPAAALIYRVESDDGEQGFVPDPIVIELFAHGELERPVPSHTWYIARASVLRRVGAQRTDVQVSRELTALGRAALIAGNEDTAYRALDEAAKLSDLGQRQKIGDMIVTERESPLVSSRRGDGIFRRLKPIKALAEGRRFQAGQPVLGSDDGSRRILAWIYRQHTVRTCVRVLVLGLADVLSTGAGLFVGLWLQSNMSGVARPFSAGRAVSGSFLGLWVAVTIFVFASAGLYRKDAARARLGAIAGAVAIVAIFGLISVIAEGEDPLKALEVAAGGALVTFVVDLGLRFSYDVISRKWVRKHGLEARTMLIGPPEEVALVERALKGLSRPSDVVGYLSEEPEAPLGASGTPETKRLGGPEDLATMAQRHGIGRVILADPELDRNERQQLADRCHESGMLVEARASFFDIRSGSAHFVLGQPLVLMQLLPLWQRNFWLFVKRSLDFSIALVAFILVAIPLGIIWILVSRQGSPGIIRTLRIGVGGESFYMLRFRTAKGEKGMRIDLLEDDDPEEPERTRLGRFLRKRAIDELPQLINVLRGQMSLVGPRPLELHHHVNLSDMALQRYVAKPGATGPWQVCRQTTLSYSELTSLDIAYLRKWSLLVDLEILVRSVWVALKRQELPQVVQADGESLPNASG